MKIKGLNILIHDKNRNVTLSAVEMLMKTIFLRYSTYFVSELRSKYISNSLMLRLTFQLKFIFCHVLKCATY